MLYQLYYESSYYVMLCDIMYDTYVDSFHTGVGTSAVLAEVPQYTIIQSRTCLYKIDTWTDKLPDGVRTSRVTTEVSEFQIIIINVHSICLDKIDTWTDRPVKGFTANAQCYLKAFQTNFNSRAAWPTGPMQAVTNIPWPAGGLWLVARHQ